MFISHISFSPFNSKFTLVEQLQKPNKIALLIGYIACGIILTLTIYNVCSYLFWESRKIKPTPLPEAPSSQTEKKIQSIEDKPIAKVIEDKPIAKVIEDSTMTKSPTDEFESDEEDEDDDEAILGLSRDSPISNSAGYSLPKIHLSKDEIVESAIVVSAVESAIVED